MAWGDNERAYYFGDPNAAVWDASQSIQRYFGGRPEVGPNRAIHDGAAVTRGLFRTLFRLSQLAPDAAHLMRAGCGAVAVTALHNGGNLEISWPCCVWVACGCDLIAAPQGLAPNEDAIYVGVPSPDSNARLRGVARHPPFCFVEVTDQMLDQNGALPTWPIDGGLTDKHYDQFLGAAAERHPERHCIVPADQLF